MKLLWIALAGAAGTLARYGLGSWIQRIAPTSFPIGTLAVNTIGCFLFGFVWNLAEERALISGETRVVLLAGFMGAFTTFSTYAFESGQMLREAEWTAAAANLSSHVVLGLIALFLGLAAGRLV